jgi:hypothetical protein
MGNGRKRAEDSDEWLRRSEDNDATSERNWSIRIEKK